MSHGTHYMVHGHPIHFFRIPYKMVIIKIPLNHHWMTSPYYIMVINHEY